MKSNALRLQDVNWTKKKRNHLILLLSRRCNITRKKNIRIDKLNEIEGDLYLISQHEDFIRFLKYSPNMKE